MITIIKEQYGGLKIYDGEPFAKNTVWAVVRPLFWGKKGVDEVVIHYRGVPSAELVSVAEEFKQKLIDKLVGKPQSVFIDWIDNVEFEEIRD